MIRWCLLFAASLAVAAPEQAVTSFETDAEQPFTAAGVTLSRVTDHATDGRYTLKVVVPGSEKDTWPGFLLKAGDQDWSARDLLSMDIFLEGKQGETLSYRLDDTHGKASFGSARLNPGLNRNWGVPVKGLAAEVDLKHVKQLLLYVRIPNHDVTFTVDRVLWTRYDARFARLGYADDATALAPTADDRARGFQLFARPALSLVFPTSRPDRSVERLECFAARGEQEPVTFALHALADLPVTVTVSDLAGPGGAKLPAAAWDRRVVEYLDKRWDYHADRYIADVPSYLAAVTGPVPAAAGRNRQFQLTLSVPADAAAGVYRGTVTVDGGRGARTLPLRVRVLPFTLPEPGALYGEYYQRLGKYNDTAEKMRADLADMRAHGMTTVGLCFGVDQASYQVTGEQVTFSFKGDTPFEWLMNAWRELGFSQPVVLLSDSGQDAAATAGKLGDARYDAVYVNFHKALAAEAKRRGWPEIYVQPVDEPGWQTQADRVRNVYLLKLLKAAGIPTEQDGPGDPYFHDQAGPYADIWDYNGAIGPREVVAKAQAAGHKITIYNNDVESYRPEVDRWAYGWFNWAHRLDGGFNWEYMGGRGDLYNDQDGPSGDWMHHYPAENAHPGGPSLAWEATREGVDDRRYARLVEDLLARAEAKGGQAAAAAQAVRAELELVRERCAAQTEVRARASWTALATPQQAQAAGLSVDPKADKVVVGQLKQPNGLAFEEYDTLRWLFAGHALRLLAALGEGAPPAVTAAAPAPAGPRLTVVRRAQGQSVAAPRPTTPVPALPAAPTLDGALDGDPGWAGAASVKLARSDGAGPTEMPTEAKLGLRDGVLYVGFICAEDRLDKLTASVRKPDGPVWEDDCVEVFLDPGCTENAYLQVVVNSLGTVARIAKGATSWKADVRAAARVDRERKQWTVEMAIPAADLPLAPRFGLNLARERRPMEVLELSTWSVTGGGFGDPKRFGTAVVEGQVPGGAPAIAPRLTLALSPTWTRVGQDRVEVATDATVAEPAKAKLTLAIDGQGKHLTADVPSPIGGRLTSALAVGDLSVGRYTVTATLTAPGFAPVTATAPLVRIEGVF